MKLGTITRGDRKIYMLLTADCPQGGSIVAESHCQGDDAVPALVAAKDAARGEYVLILPLLYVEQTVTVRVLDAEGAVLDEESQKVRHLSSALTAKYNTLSKAPGVNDIRNFDRYARSDISHIEPDRICYFGYEPQNSELVHIVITTHCDDASTYQTPFEVIVFDRQGKRMPIRDRAVLSDKLDHPVPHSDFTRRTIHTSFLKEHGNDWFFIWVRFADDALPPAFICMDKWRTEDVRDRFQRKFNDSGQGPFYEDWFYHTQKKSPMELDGQRRAHFEIEPLFSIIVPLYKTPLDFFAEMSQSVLEQTYGKFELILVNSTPEDKELAAAVAACAANDDRVRVVTLDKNYGIAGNTNEGIAIAQGDFLCFFDHDDILEPSILFEYVDAINRYPETDLLYCDEDKIRDGKLFDGFLKTDFSWELLATCNYVCHLLTVRKSIVDAIELSGDEVTGAQDWDMTLKVAEKARNIFHVRKVLYHWRSHEHSAASNANAKPYTHKAGEIAVRNHYERIGIPVDVLDGFCGNMHRIVYHLPEKKPLVSIIIPNKDQAFMLERCLESIWEKTTYENFEIIIVENNSVEDETFALYERLQAEHDNLRVVRFEGSFNYSAICNLGVAHAVGDHYLFLNNDMEVITPDWIELLLGPLQREEVAVVGARLLYPDRTIQHDGVVIPRSDPKHVACMAPASLVYYFGMIHNARDVLAVTGACLMVSRKDFESVEGFDERYAVAYNDVDFCLRLVEKGRHVIIDPNIELYHYESVSRGFDETVESKMRNAEELAMFQKRWPRFIAEGDPYYGTNIAHANAYYALNWDVRA